MVEEKEKEKGDKEIVAKALHGQRYPMPLCVCSDVVNGRGAAAPEGQMTYDSTQDDFLRFPNSEF